MTLIEVLIGLAIISALTIGVYNLMIYVVKVGGENKLRMGAIMLADQKMEFIKNLSYNDIGTISGIVHGNIPDNETIADTNGRYYINTLVQYVDDAFDGVFPADLIPNDYKQAKVRVRWIGPFGIKEINVFTKVAPKGIERNAGGGVLTINVINANGQPVSQANVNIQNTLVSPAINFDAVTDATGVLNFPGATSSIEGYQITAAKTGYSTASTTARSASNPNPTLVNASILEGQRTVIAMQIDILSTLVIKAIDQPLPANWQINTDTSTENQTNSRIAIDEIGNIYVVWQDYRSSADAKIYGQKYNSARVKQWASDVVIGNANNQVLPEIKLDSAANLYVSWNDNSNGNQDCFYSKRASSTGEDLWSGPKKIDTLSDSSDQNISRQYISGNGGGTLETLVWQDNRTGNLDVYMQRYDPLKNPIWAAEKKVNRNSDTSDQSTPVVAVDLSGNIYSAWTDRRNGDQDIYMSKFDSAGTPLWTDDIIANNNSGTSNQYQPSIAIDRDGYVYLAWTDERNGNTDIFLGKFNASGTPIWSPTNIIGASTSSAQYQPSLAVSSSSKLYLAWTDERNGNQDIYAQKIDTNGMKLWADDMRININNDISDQYNPYIAMNPLTDRPYVTWQDNRSGNFDIYASEFEAYGSSAPVGNVPIILKGSKRIGENPVILKYSRNLTIDSSGMLNLNNIEWDSYSLEIATTSYSAYHLVLTEPQTPVTVDPDTMANLILYLAP